MAVNRLGDIRILLVDDEKQILTLVSDVLSHLGFRDITKAMTGRMGMELVAKQKFDFIITDWRMPDAEGIDLVRFIRNDSKSLSPHVPVIMLSGNTEAHYILEARDAGVNEYVIKPFTAEQIVKRLRAIIERPRSYIEAPRYRGPNRRWHRVTSPHGAERRKNKEDESR